MAGRSVRGGQSRQRGSGRPARQAAPMQGAARAGVTCGWQGVRGGQRTLQTMLQLEQQRATDGHRIRLGSSQCQKAGLACCVPLGGSAAPGPPPPSSGSRDNWAYTRAGAPLKACMVDYKRRETLQGGRVRAGGRVRFGTSTLLLAAWPLAAPDARSGCVCGLRGPCARPPAARVLAVTAPSNGAACGPPGLTNRLFFVSATCKRVGKRCSGGS